MNINENNITQGMLAPNPLICRYPILRIKTLEAGGWLSPGVSPWSGSNTVKRFPVSFSFHGIISPKCKTLFLTLFLYSKFSRLLSSCSHIRHIWCFHSESAKSPNEMNKIAAIFSTGALFQCLVSKIKLGLRESRVYSSWGIKNTNNQYKHLSLIHAFFCTFWFISMQ